MVRAAEIALIAVLAVVFAWAGALKIARPRRWRESLSMYGLPRPVRVAALLGVPWVEMGVAAGLALGLVVEGAAAAAVLAAAFTVAILRARSLQRSDKLDCGCFGGRTARDYRVLLLRNGAIEVAALLVLGGAVNDLARRSASASALLVAYVVLFVAAGCWVGWQLVRHYRAIATTRA
jgi:uncharacterized membrane protein YphA (DoxX/SURF4 family)